MSRPTRTESGGVALKVIGVLLLAAFGLLEILRLEGFHTIAQLNWVIGWLLFQIAGFAC